MRPLIRLTTFSITLALACKISRVMAAISRLITAPPTLLISIIHRMAVMLGTGPAAAQQRGGSVYDAFNAFGTTGHVEPISNTDLLALQALGYQRTYWSKRRRYMNGWLLADQKHLRLNFGETAALAVFLFASIMLQCISGCGCRLNRSDATTKTIQPSERRAASTRWISRSRMSGMAPPSRRKTRTIGK